MADTKENMMTRVPVREQDPKVRATNFEEVCLGYNEAEALEEAHRCLQLQKPEMCRGLSGEYPDSGVLYTR